MKAADIAVGQRDLQAGHADSDLSSTQAENLGPPAAADFEEAQLKSHQTHHPEEAGAPQRIRPCQMKRQSGPPSEGADWTAHYDNIVRVESGWQDRLGRPWRGYRIGVPMNDFPVALFQPENCRHT